MRRIGTTRALQIGFLGLLFTGVAQATYWIVDLARQTNLHVERVSTLYHAQAASVRELVAAGADPQALAGMHPYLRFADGTVAVDPEALDVLQRERRRKLNQYGWEGSFFILVLLSGMGVIAMALRQRAALLKRQQNFVAAVSHEFKSPLASLKLSAETLLVRRPDEEGRARIVDRMLQDVDRLETMVTNILDAARIDEGRLKLATERVELGPELERVAAEASCRAHLRGVEVAVEAPGALAVAADPHALHVVVTNLVHNAVKATGVKGGGAVRLSAARDGRDVRVDVSDEGLGFDPREAGRLFDKFYRPGDELRRKTKGSGLGLYVVRHFVEQNGGRVRAESPGPGRGATFRVWWPAAEPVTGSAGAAPAPEEARA